jgi:hypothetical protein
MMKLFTLPPSRQRLVSSAKSLDDDLGKGGTHPIKPSLDSRNPLLFRRHFWQRHVPFKLPNHKWTSSSMSSHAPDPVTSSSASSSSVAEYSYHDSSSISNASLALGYNPSIVHEVRSVPSMGESVLGVYLETSPSGDTLVPSANRDDAAQNRKGEGIKPSTRFKSCLRVPDWVRKWTAPSGPSPRPRRTRHGRLLRRPDRFRQWRYGGGIPRQPLASSSDGSNMDDENDDNDVDSLQASAHFSISCVSNSRNSNAMDRLAWNSHDDEDEEDEDEFYEARHEEASPILTDTMRSSSSSSTASPPGRRPFMTLDSYLSRHNPQVMKSKASKVTKTTAASTSAATPSTGVMGGGAKVVDIAHVDTCDNQSVHSEMCMAVSFDHDYAQLVLTATAQDDDSEDDDDDELSTFAGDDLLGIAHSHPAAGASGARCPSPPPSFVRGESQAPPPRYSMRQNLPHTGANPRPLSVRPRNPWRDMVVEEGEDDDAGSFRGVEEWSVAAASVLIETTFTDWGASHDDDDEDEDADASNSKHGGGAVLAAASLVKVRHTPLGAGSLPPRPPGAAQRPLTSMPLDGDPGSPSDRGEEEEDEESFRSDESECPFDERAFKAPHLRSAQPGRRSQFASAPRSGSKRAVPLVEV